MTFDEAIEQGYTILVADYHLAKKLQTKYKKNIFKSIRSNTKDGISNVYIDQKLYFSFYEEIDKMQKLCVTVILGHVPEIK